MLQESQDWNLGQPQPQGRGTQQYNVSCRANTQRKTPDGRKWQPWRLDGSHAKSFVAGTRKHECSICAIQWKLLWPENILQIASSKCRHYLEKMDSRVFSTMEPEIEVAKRKSAILKEGELVHCEHRLGRINEIFFLEQRFCAVNESKIGTWRAEPASREVSASFLRFCLPDQKPGRQCCRQLKSATKSHQTTRINFWKWKIQNMSKLKNSQNWKFLQIETENLYTPRLFEGKSWETPGYATRLGLTLS